MTNLQLLWFLLIGVLFSGFFFLEGFDFGIGMAVRFFAKNRDERDVVIQTIGPHWDGNEVWLITAGGAMFASFPMWYASLFSGYYLVLFLILVALIFRGVSFEFRANMQTDTWRNFWEWAASIGSFCAAFLFGMMFVSMIQGMPIDANGNIFGSFTDYVNWFSLVGGVAVSLLCFIHGLNFLRLKTTGELRDRAQKWSKILYPVLLAGEVVFVILLYLTTDFFAKKPVSTWSILIALVIFTLAAWWGARAKHDWASFIASGLSLISVVVLIFNGLFPRVMIANNSANSILIKNASSSPYTLHLMTILTFTILPIVLIYFIWSYWVFYKRLKSPRAAEQ
ncbi:cytochrome d ubiquinol oxidase subunit II [Lentilactobacillus sp. IMAU92037]|uniref:cytochrome d ubiquinol oxidase subunit II n=1 Tax=Lentilactobacillus TaxID=2767893 RepID=UPI001C26950F|nr:MULTISPECIES: cytochrome d ubiquinol oxidase subunit II [Lentilactobacillus]MBU9788678.1 cytochrome d ubiquinol oxidase subunit II [Lentilactobacillus dabitei]MBV0931483.1 cytochrome d ubiquinol oxidase subunit II [Lentilactobacillus dabitei]MDM7515459.1 cytochrome d ubiquinol oxidase subunit II [Lentilactobacillus sp. TOM.63]